jgi:para-nitrobenzyl esterase
MGRGMRKHPLSVAILFAASLFAISALILGSAAARVSTAKNSGTSSTVVKIEAGKVRGVVSGGLEIFKGVPYAAPPVGNLRWRPPQPVKRWKGVRAATDLAPDCMQRPYRSDAAPLRTTPSEDCLYLNVWAPRKHSGKLPVMVWIYGGGMVNGGSSPAAYDGSHLADKGVVFVSFNYRLGRFGFFAFPALQKENGRAGNYALMDQIAALQWVRHNIAAFGGNPDEVTVFGQSAGGRSVNVLVTSPAAKGLFSRAIIESASRSNQFAPVQLDQVGPNGTPSAMQRGINFAHAMAIDGTDEKALAALRALPAQKVVSRINIASMARQSDTFPGLILDGTILPRMPEDTYEHCMQNPVSVMVGGNSADLGSSSAKTMDALFAPFGTDEAAARKAFDGDSTATFATVARRVGMVKVMLEPARFIAQRVAACGQASYVYRFSYVATPLRGRLSGAPHSSEIPFVFETLPASSWGNLGKGLTQADFKMSEQVSAYWVNFAEMGDPNAGPQVLYEPRPPGDRMVLPYWPKYTTSGDGLMNFTMNHGPQGGPDPWAAQLDAVAKIQQ